MRFADPPPHADRKGIPMEGTGQCDLDRATQWRKCAVLLKRESRKNSAKQSKPFAGARFSIGSVTDSNEACGIP